MEIQIVTPSENIVTDTVDEVYAYGPKGEFGILAGHAHYVSPLAVGRLSYQKGGRQKTLLVQGGYLEVLDEKVFVLADHVEKPNTIDRTTAQQRLSELDQQLASETLEPEQFKQLIQERDLQQVRLQVTE